MLTLTPQKKWAMLSLLSTFAATSVLAEINIQHRLHVPNIEQEAVEPTPNMELSLTPPIINQGESAQLQWVGHKISHIKIDGVVHHGQDGQISVSPSDTKTYQVDASNLHGDISKSVTLTVIQPEPEVNASVSSDVILDWNSTTLSWSSLHADTLTLDGQEVSLTGELAVSPTQNQTYTFLAKSDELTVEQQITVQVTPRNNISCKTLLDQDSSLPNGNYTLIPGDAQSQKSYFCDMFAGGWTQVFDLKAPTSGNFGDFTYSSTTPNAGNWTSFTTNAYGIQHADFDKNSEVPWTEARMLFVPRYHATVDGFSNTHGGATNRDSLDGMPYDGLMIRNNNQFVAGFSPSSNPTREQELGITGRVYYGNNSYNNFTITQNTFAKSVFTVRAMLDQVTADEQAGWYQWRVWVR